MSREFVAALPEHLRSIYDKPAEPDPMQTYFQTLQKQEAMKKAARENSVLYKLFGEHLFGFMTIDGWLNINVPMVDVRELNRTFIEEMAIMQAMMYTLDDLGDSKFSGEFPVNRDGVSVMETISVHFNHNNCSLAIEEAYDEFKEARQDLIKMFNKPECAYSFPARDSVFVTKDEHEAVNGMRGLINSTRHPKHPMNHSSSQEHYFYFRQTVKMKPLARSIRDIRW